MRNPILIRMPNRETTQSTNTMFLPQKNLPLQARRAHIVPHLQHPLIYIGTICDNKCIAMFDDKPVTVYNKDTR